jgi:UDP:flavonoid glycosyltransferase YjiC (YdhE family)
MKVLFTCVVGHGHFHPMVPLAQALEAAGHQVAFATDPRFCGYVRAVGFEAYPAGLNQPEARARFMADTPDWAELPPGDQMRRMMTGLFARTRVPPMLRDLAPVIDAWRPELLIHDSVELGGAIAAEVAGVAHAEHSFGLLRPASFRRESTRALDDICADLGVRNPGVGGIEGELYLDVCPPTIQQPEIAEVPRVQTMRPVGFDASPTASLPTWLESLPPRPTVYVTLGTVFNQAEHVFRMVLEGIRDQPMNVIVTVGEDGDPTALGEQPPNVHVERYIPQSLLLPGCDLLVSHCGSGAMLGAVNAGVPMLAVPQGADQFMNAERIVDTGLGLRLMPDELTRHAVETAVKEVIENDRYRNQARMARAATLRMPEPQDVVPVLEAFAA